MDSNIRTLNKGFTLIELIISLFLMTLILGAVFHHFYFQYSSYENLYGDITSMEKLRFLSIQLEKQICNTPRIYVVEGTVYLRDIETPEYYNYYTLTNKILYKTKTHSDLKDIGLGSKSQIANKIENFFITYIDSKTIQLTIEVSEGKKKARLQKDISVLGQVTVIN
ncbi:PilW family protein [Alkalibaculum bacchi]|uniref:PilW family protein n=1 Tax=Alkalibaculum bacchi TaxID=645887 RepID=UPI0026ED4BB1|nr:prepilin-type N-terminal cleavage/methylation domain-containing protein [Alkalibaculum bacchi]